MDDSKFDRNFFLSVQTYKTLEDEHVHPIQQVATAFFIMLLLQDFIHFLKSNVRSLMYFSRIFSATLPLKNRSSMMNSYFML